MSDVTDAVATLIAKDEIRDLAMLYSRSVDRRDMIQLRDLYTQDATDSHGEYFDGSASDYVEWLEASLKHLAYCGHHICNHLISVQGDEGEGEVYAIAYHILPDADGQMMEEVQIVRYLDQYRRENGRWKFARRQVAFDLCSRRPVDPATAERADGPEDASYQAFTHDLFARRMPNARL